MIATLKAKAIAAAVIAVIGFGGGWVVHGWKEKAADAIELRAVMSEMRKEAKRMKDFNDAAAKREAATLASVADLSDAMENLLNEARDLQLGTCNFTPDADRMRSEAHRQAYPPR